MCLDFSNLENIYNINNLKTIGPHAFDHCVKLKNIDLPDSLESIEHNAFDSTAIKHIYIPPKISILNEEVFTNCTHLEKIIFSKMSTLKKIGKCCFRNCNSLKYIKLPKSLEVLGYDAFCNCFNLKIIFIPKSIKIIEKFAFKKCTNLTHVIFY
jgi:hypothetical protein